MVGIFVVRMVKFSNVSYQLSSGETLLSDINLELKENEKVIILGANGSGKSTLGFLLAEVLYPSQGEVIWDTEIHPGDVQLLMQNPARQILTKNIRQELSLLPLLKGCTKQQIDSLTKPHLEELSLDETSELYRLSGGELQSVMLRAITILPPRLLIADEPTNDLPPLRKKEVLERIMAFPIAVVWFSLSSKEAKQFQRAIVLNNGRIVLDIPTDELCYVTEKQWLQWKIEPIWESMWQV